MFPRGTTATECRRGSYTERERNKYIKGEERRGERGSEAADRDKTHREGDERAPSLYLPPVYLSLLFF